MFLGFSQFCVSAEELVLIYGLADNSSASPGLGRADMARLSPALLQQILSGACAKITEPLAPDALTKTESKCGTDRDVASTCWLKKRTKLAGDVALESSLRAVIMIYKPLSQEVLFTFILVERPDCLRLTKVSREHCLSLDILITDLHPPFLFSLPLVGYLYATIANVVITLTSMFGIVVLLCTSCTSMFQLCIQFCISLAVGSLTGDALLHLLPMVTDFNTFKSAMSNCLTLGSWKTPWV